VARRARPPFRQRDALKAMRYGVKVAQCAFAEARLWGPRIGAVVLDDDDVFASFQYDPDFLEAGI